MLFNKYFHTSTLKIIFTAFFIIIFKDSTTKYIIYIDIDQA